MYLNIFKILFYRFEQVLLRNEQFFLLGLVSEMGISGPTQDKLVKALLEHKFLSKPPL